MEYDSDEETEGGTWEHKRRKEEMDKTQSELRASYGGHTHTHNVPISHSLYVYSCACLCWVKANPLVHFCRCPR